MFNGSFLPNVILKKFPIAVDYCRACVYPYFQHVRGIVLHLSEKSTADFFFRLFFLLVVG